MHKVIERNLFIYKSATHFVSTSVQRIIIICDYATQVLIMRSRRHKWWSTSVQQKCVSTSMQHKCLSTIVQHNCYLRVCNTIVFLRVCNKSVYLRVCNTIVIYECTTQLFSTSVQHKCLSLNMQHNCYLRVCNTIVIYECATKVCIYEYAT